MGLYANQMMIEFIDKMAKKIRDRNNGKSAVRSETSGKEKQAAKGVKKRENK